MHGHGWWFRFWRAPLSFFKRTAIVSPFWSGRFLTRGRLCPPSIGGSDSGARSMTTCHNDRSRYRRRPWRRQMALLGKCSMFKRSFGALIRLLPPKKNNNKKQNTNAHGMLRLIDGTPKLIELPFWQQGFWEPKGYLLKRTTIPCLSNRKTWECFKTVDPFWLGDSPTFPIHATNIDCIS